MNPLNAIISGVIFIIGMVMFLMIWTPLMTLAETLMCTETMTSADMILGIILFVPAIVTFVGLIGIISSVYSPSNPGQGY